MRNSFRLAVAATAFAALAGSQACTGDDASGIGEGDGAFDAPDDFDASECASQLPIDSIDPAGVWHADVAFPDRAGVLAFRIEADGASAFFGDAETEDVRLTPDHLFVHSMRLRSGVRQETAALLCEVDDRGRLAGPMAACFDDRCIVGRMTAYPTPPLDEPEAENIALVSEWRGEATRPWTETVSINVRHHGTVAYLVGQTDGLRIVDLADPAQPADLGHLPPRYPGEELYNDIKIAESESGVYAFVASNRRGVVIVDVTDPADPVEVDVFPEPPIGGERVSVHTLFSEGDRLYTATTSLSGLEIFDIADPRAPVALGSYVHSDVGSLGGYVHDLYVEDGVVYLNYWNRGLVVVDAHADPAHPTLVGVFNGYQRRTSHSNWVTEAGGRKISVHGDEDFGSHVRIVDVDPTSSTAFEEIGAYETRPQVSVHNIMAVGDRALVAYYQDGLRVLDLSDPTRPTEVAHFATWPGRGPDYGRSFFEGAIGVDYDAERDLILVADTHRGLLVLRQDD